MAADGFLPRFLVGTGGGPPVASVVLQGVLSFVLLFLHGLGETVQNVGAILTLFSALTAFSLFWVRFRRPELPRPPATSLACAAVYVVSALWMLYFGLKGSSHLLEWLLAPTAIALVAYALTRRRVPSS
jgi:amino acid transporter